MPFPKQITGINRRVVNPVIRRLAARAPMMAVVVHRGRTSGRTYRAPVLAFVRGQRVTVALTYGADVDWLKNVRAANGCRLIRRGREREATNPRMLATSAGMARMPAPIRLVLRLSNVTAFVELTER